MDTDEIKEEIAHQRALSNDYKKRLRVVERQIAQLGESHAPSHKAVEMEELNEKIRSCESRIYGLIMEATMDKRIEKEAFQSMIKVISNWPASKWIFSAILYHTSDYPVDLSNEKMGMIIRTVRDMCSTQIQRLEIEIAEIENLA